MRYRAEFRVEVLELPRRARLGYSLRVLAGAWQLRRALVEAMCTPDGAAAVLDARQTRHRRHSVLRLLLHPQRQTAARSVLVKNGDDR